MKNQKEFSDIPETTIGITLDKNFVDKSKMLRTYYSNRSRIVRNEIDKSSHKTLLNINSNR
jgi:hypothetical protein